MLEYEGHVCSPGDAGKIAIVVAKFNNSITEKLLEGALAKLREHMVSEELISVVRVPGAFEIPTIAQRFALDEEYIAVICLGCVIKGETSHDEHINRAVSLELAHIGAEYGIPVIFGLLTCNTVEQALARSGQLELSKDKAVDVRPGNKGAEAAEAALEMIDLLGKLPEMKFEDDDEEDDVFDRRSIDRNAARYVRGDFEPVDVDPNELVEIDDEDDENGGDWFFPGGDYSKKADSRRPAGAPGKGSKKDGAKSGNFGSKSKPYKPSGKSAPKKGGDKKTRK